MGLGCGYFSDQDWAEVIAPDDPKKQKEPTPLLSHLQSCAACRQEFDSLSHLGAQVRLTLSESPDVRAAFVESVLAETESKKPVRNSPFSSIGLWPKAAAAAAVSILFLAFALYGPIFTQPNVQDASSGYSVSGGTVYSSSQSADRSVAARLTTLGTVSAAAGSWQGEDPSDSAHETAPRARALQTSKGFASASAVGVSHLETLRINGI